MFKSITLNASKIEAVYSPAFQVLAKFVPEWNKKFEPTKNPAKSEVFRDVAVTTPDKRTLELLESRNKIRTFKNPYPTTRIAPTTYDSRRLLPN